MVKTKQSVDDGEEKKSTIKKRWLIILVGVVVIGLIVAFTTLNNARLARENEQRVLEEIQANQATKKEDPYESVPAGVDTDLLKRQERLIKRYGEPPEGFLLDTDGSLLALGDKTLSANDVAHTYLRAVSTLDMSTASRYTYKSTVLKTYSGYFSDENRDITFKDQFTHAMYRSCLLSMQVDSIGDNAVFADNRQTFTVQANILDLTNKDFWVKDKKTIMETMYQYDVVEGDMGKAQNYVYEYIKAYYESEGVQLSPVKFDITLGVNEKVDSGYLVMVDTGLDNICKNRDGEQVVSYILEQYRIYKADRKN